MTTGILDSIKEQQTRETDPNSKDSAEITAKKRKHGIAICLSGGGYRAALFHLGGLRCLHEMGILQKVETISSVSGGSIVSAYIAKRMVEKGLVDRVAFDDWENDVSKGFRSFVMNDIRTVPVVVHVLWNWLAPKLRAFHLIRYYRRKLTTITVDGRSKELMLTDLPQKPYFTFCSTDLTFGVNWIFTREEVGDYQVGYRESEGWTLAGAVTASSCFPPIFGPIKLTLAAAEFKDGKYASEEGRPLLSSIQLTDGGVYDNFGLEPVDANHETVIISDGGSPFAYVSKRGPVGRLLRYTTVIMNQTAALRKRAFFTGINKKWHSGTYAGINSGSKPAQTEGHIVNEPDLPPTEGDVKAKIFAGYSESVARKRIASIRTDLDRFCDAEACVLENHGYFVMHDQIKRNAAHLLTDPTLKPKTPHPKWADESLLASKLKSSHRRFSLPRLLRIT